MSSGMRPISLRVPVTPMVRKIIKANAIIYIVTAVLFGLSTRIESLQGVWKFVWSNLYLFSDTVSEGDRLWTLLTYAWFHDLGLAQGFTLGQPIASIAATALAVYGMVALYRSRWGQQEFFLFIIGIFFINSSLF